MQWAFLLFGFATAVATAITAYAVWHQWRGSIQVEWEPQWLLMYEKSIPPRLDVRVTVRNYRNFAVKAWRVDVTGCPVTDVVAGKMKKHESWGVNQAAVDIHAEPGASGGQTVSVFLDWPSLAERPSVIRRPNSSTSLRIQITLASKSSRRWRAKYHTTIPVPNDRIMKAAKVAQK